MPRQIRSAKDITAGLTETNLQENTFKDRLVKLIPSEIVTAYITLQGLITSRPNDQQLFILIAFICLLILTPLYLKYISKVTKTEQIIFTTIAFVIWVMASGGFHIMLPDAKIFNDDFLGSILLVIYTLLIPFVYKG